MLELCNPAPLLILRKMAGIGLLMGSEAPPIDGSLIHPQTIIWFEVRYQSLIRNQRDKKLKLLSNTTVNFSPHSFIQSLICKQDAFLLICYGLKTRLGLTKLQYRQIQSHDPQAHGVDERPSSSLAGPLKKKFDVFSYYHTPSTEPTTTTLQSNLHPKQSRFTFRPSHIPPELYLRHQYQFQSPHQSRTVVKESKTYERRKKSLEVDTGREKWLACAHQDLSMLWKAHNAWGDRC